MLYEEFPMLPNRHLFRSVDIPGYGTGRLFLHSLPGVREPIEKFLDETKRKEINQVISLMTPYELGTYSPAYAQIIQKKLYPWEHVMFGIPDWGVPDNWQSFLDLAVKTADAIFKTQPPIRVLVHGYAGIGRTGTFSIIVLMAGGFDRVTAELIIRSHGSGPQGKEQVRLIDWCETEIKKIAWDRDLHTGETRLHLSDISNLIHGLVTGLIARTADMENPHKTGEIFISAHYFPVPVSRRSEPPQRG